MPVDSEAGVKRVEVRYNADAGRRARPQEYQFGE